MAANPNGQKLAELAALIDAVKKRVRTQYPQGKTPAGTVCVGLPDLTPVARARDAAAGKMAAIGSVNPRAGGVVNDLIQAIKRMVARSLNWFVRDQIVFNRQMVTCVETSLETLSEINQTIHALALQVNAQIQLLRAETEPLRAEAASLRATSDDLLDLASHWNRWREEWQLKLHKNEVEFLKSVADLNLAFQQRVMHLDAASEQRINALQDACRSNEQQTQALGGAFSKTTAEMEANYRAATAQLEANFQGIVNGMEAEFRKALEGLDSAYTEKISRIENDVTVAFQTQHDAFENLARSNAEAIQKSASEQITALADERHQWAVAMQTEMADHAAAFEKSLATAVSELQKKFYGDLDRIRLEYERIIHSELRVVRQRLAIGAAVPQPAAAVERDEPVRAFDAMRFASRFRGSEEYVAAAQRFYLPYFAKRRHVLDLGCGRGEFLKLMQEAHVPARGIDASVEAVAYCRSLGLEAEQADLYAYLAQQGEASLDGIFCSQVVEHLRPERLPELIRLSATRLVTGGVLAIETPNPECLAVFATHFFLDPTHTRPVPSQLLAFYMEESGLGRVEVHKKAQAIESIPELGELPAGIREKLFGGLDYAILAYRL